MLEGLNETTPPNILPVRLMVRVFGFQFPALHFLFETFDKKLQQYSEGGFIGHHVNNIKAKFTIKRLQKTKKPFAVLTLAELEAGFVITLVPFVLCLFVFCSEWLVTTKDLIIFFVIFEKYFGTKDFEQKRRSELVKIKMAAVNALKAAINLSLERDLETEVQVEDLN